PPLGRRRRRLGLRPGRGDRRVVGQGGPTAQGDRSAARRSPPWGRRERRGRCAEGRATNGRGPMTAERDTVQANGPGVASRPLAVAVSRRGLFERGEPVLAADDEGFTRGRAAFETMRVYGGRPFRFEQHVTRLVNSAAR